MFFKKYLYLLLIIRLLQNIIGEPQRRHRGFGEGENVRVQGCACGSERASASDTSKSRLAEECMASDDILNPKPYTSQGRYPKP